MNLSFINSAFLYLLPLTLLPVIIHLFFRKKTKYIYFSDLRFINLANKNVAPKKKIQQILLLIIRCLILLFLNLAFARPVGYLGGMKQADKTRQVLFLLDTSYSMGYNAAGVPKIAEARSIAGKIIDRMFPKETGTLNKQAGIILFSSYVSDFSRFTNDPQYLNKFISQAKTGSSSTDLLPAFKHAYEMFSQYPDTQKTIIVISDMQSNIFKTATPETASNLEKFNPLIQVIFIDVGASDAQNSALEAAKLLEEPLRISALAENFSSNEVSTPLLLSIKGKTVYDNTVRLEPGKAVNYEIGLSVLNDSELYGNLKIQEDALSIDDIYYFSYPLKTRKKVLIIDGDPKFGSGINSESYYLNYTIASRDSDRYDVKIYSPEELERENNIEKYSAIFICNVSELTNLQLDRLERFLTTFSKKNLAVFLGDKVNPEKYPAWLAGNIGIIQEQNAYVAQPVQPASMFKNIESFEVSKIFVRKYFKLNTMKAEVVLALDNEDPLLIEKQIDNSKIFIFASTADREWTNLPSKPFFPYFVRTLIDTTEIDTDVTQKLIYSAGDVIRYSPEEEFSQARIELPSGENAIVRIVQGNKGKEVIFTDTALPGIYELQLYSQSRVITRHFAVNPQDIEHESNPAKADLSVVKNKLPKVRLIFLKEDKELYTKVFTILEGKELSKEFFVIVLVLLGLEVLLANMKFRRKKL
ncbi:MAG: hypothetical protein A2252_05460 [Elusimicrobia bacterium RIFOXYA2_FULL_39_19]|nr:MAG: hypothetical protein A2252_05460 [Elusimicrobia bacterium RIFOXYA2_FULL_39_19]